MMFRKEHEQIVTGFPAPRCSAYPMLRDIAHLTAESAFRNVRYKFVSQIFGCRDLRVGPPALAGRSQGPGGGGHARAGCDGEWRDCPVWSLSEPAVGLAPAGEAGVASGGAGRTGFRPTGGLRCSEVQSEPDIAASAEVIRIVSGEVRIELAPGTFAIRITEIVHALGGTPC